jgi:hypothetical protein
MTGDGVLDGLEREPGRLLGADGHSPRAAGAKAAARGRVEGAGQVAGERWRPLTARSVGIGRGSHERLSVRVQRPRVDRVGAAPLYDLAEVHHSHPVAQVLHDVQVVGDEQRREAVPRPQVHEQVEHLRLHRLVERRHGLVGDQQARADDEGAGEIDALALAARQLVGVAGGVAPREAHVV